MSVILETIYDLEVSVKNYLALHMHGSDFWDI